MKIAEQNKEMFQELEQNALKRRGQTTGENYRRHKAKK